MKGLTLALLGIILCTGCNQQQSDPPQPSTKAEIAPEIPKIDHYYSMKDGFEYGYERAVSQDAENAGQVASTLVMFKYAGNHDGNYQVYSKEDYATTVLQCSNPCDFMKIMVFAKGAGHVKTERMKATEGTVGWSVISDAINGKLEQFKSDREGRKSTVWFDEVNGPQLTLVNNDNKSD